MLDQYTLSVLLTFQALMVQGLYRLQRQTIACTRRQHPAFAYSALLQILRLLRIAYKYSVNVGRQTILEAYPDMKYGRLPVMLKYMLTRVFCQVE